MKHTLRAVLFTMLCMPALWPQTIHAAEAGFVFGPVANEEALLQETLHEPLYFYDFPVFIGGPYFAKQVSEKFSYYTDFQVSIHPVNHGADRIQPVLIYHHQEIRRIFADTIQPFLGFGLELIWIYRNYENTPEYNFYHSLHFYPYLSAGVNIPLGSFRFGTTLRARIGGIDDASFSSRGEMTLHVGRVF